MLKEVSYKDLKFNPFRLIGDEWMLVTAGNEKDLLQHRTDGTDAFDTLYIGCAKFPQQSTAPISISGVL